MLDRVRTRLDASLLSLGRAFSRVSPNPSLWTLAGLALAVAAGAAYWSSGRAGELAGGALILASGFLDVVDGAVAKVTGRVSKRGAFLDSTLDRAAEVAIYLGVLQGGFAPGPYALLALALSLLVSYTRAKADALGTSLSGVGVGERSERLLVLALSSLESMTFWGVVAVIFLAGYTFVERTLRASRALA